MEIDLFKFKLPEVYYRQGQECFLCYIRNKLIPKTPEEEVRQRFIQYLHTEMSVPFEMIDIEVPMSHYKKGEQGRADIVVFGHNKDGEFIPILVIECKAESVPLTDDVFEQVYNYDDILLSDTIMVTNGRELFVEKYDSTAKKYFLCEKPPTYEALCNGDDIEIINFNPTSYKRRKYEDYMSKENLDFYKNHFGSKTDPIQYPLVININELLWDDSEKIPSELYGINIVEDIGVRYTSFGNAAGFDWTGEYRSFIVEDSNSNHQIISIGILHGYLVVAIDDYERSHNSLQLRIKEFFKSDGKGFKVHHNGRLALGDKGMMPWNEVLDFVYEKAPQLIDKNNKVDLGYIDNSKELHWNQEDVRDFFGRLIKYAIIRDEYRAFKRGLISN